MKNEIEITLLPCPFCGGEAYLNTHCYNAKSDIAILNKQRIFYGVNCIKCGADITGLVGCKNDEDAINKWNTRI